MKAVGLLESEFHAVPVLVLDFSEGLNFVTTRSIQVGNRSSEFHPNLRRVRREGSYIYEEFMPTGGTDVKVHTWL